MAENPKKTPRQRGSIRPRNGSFEVRVYAGVDPETGKPLYLTETHTDLKEAAKARTRLVAAVDASRAPLAKGSFAAAVGKWLDELQDEVDAGEMTAQTLQYYRSLAENHVIPVLGKIPMPRLDQQLVRAAERLYKSLKVCSLRCGGRMTIEHHASGQANSRILRDLTGHKCGKRCKAHTCKKVSPAVLRKVHRVVTGPCGLYHHWGLLVSDPSERIKAPKAAAPRPKSLPPRTVGRLVQAAFEEDIDWGTVNWLLLVTGARRSEVVRVQLQHVDFVRRMVFIDSTKVDGTARWVALDDFTMQLLEAMATRIATRLAAAGLSITGEEYLHSYKPDHSAHGSVSYFSHRFGTMAKRLGIDAHPHLFRHFAATELIAGGVDVVSVARRIGHTRPSTTSDIYAAWKPEADARAVDILTSGLALPAITDRPQPERDRSAEQPNRTNPELEQRIHALHRRTDWGAKRIREHLAAEEITIAESTIWKVLRRHNLNGDAIKS